MVAYTTRPRRGLAFQVKLNLIEIYPNSEEYRKVPAMMPVTGLQLALADLGMHLTWTSKTGDRTGLERSNNLKIAGRTFWSQGPKCITSSPTCVGLVRLGLSCEESLGQKLRLTVNKRITGWFLRTLIRPRVEQRGRLLQRLIHLNATT